MVRVGSLFSQLLKQIPRDVFHGLVQKFGAERYAKGFASWTQLVAMLFSQLARADSLREICDGLACCEGRLVHVGLPGRLPGIDRGVLCRTYAHGRVPPAGRRGFIHVTP